MFPLQNPEFSCQSLWCSGLHHTDIYRLLKYPGVIGPVGVSASTKNPNSFYHSVFSHHHTVFHLEICCSLFTCYTHQFLTSDSEQLYSQAGRTGASVCKVYDSGHDFTVVGLSPTWVSMLRAELAWHFLSPSEPPPSLK